MYIYNVTTNIELAIEQEWLSYIKNTHIPAMIATGCFTGAKLTRVMIQEEQGGKTFSIQYAVKDKETFKGYYVAYAADMNATLDKLFKGNYVSFQTELEVIEDYY
ncbi:hypothetical protein FHR24_000708 [Wenyingzhuangia heitensis]|uniref:DUF4286 domain-containing protein n=1 Tax=Wenyingzhuangia heitensis TaxID=1487859 RepID=A0ABX0U5Z6_9FLAO|nr:DUF4286 family protein [Wenyingzhuangia heitensis]NIJ44269.1 hypothetical protein [Wenyingzhuangia heitensis]